MAKILIAEDDSAMRHFLSGALERAGHEVETAEDGVAALAAVQDHADAPFELLLADIVMPGMDGIELSQKATKLQPALKVMFITGFAAVAQDRGATSPVLNKPFHLKELVEQVDALLNPQIGSQKSENT